MIRLTLIISFLSFMILFTFFIMYLGYSNGDSELYYLGIGLPVWFYLLWFFLKWFNKIEIDSNSFIISNVFFGKKVISFNEIEKWEEIETTWMPQRNLVLKVNGKKTVISNISDTVNYETLKGKLKAHCSETEIKYN